MGRTADKGYRRNRRRIQQTQDTCAICGRWIDPDLTYPDPDSFSADHITPISKGGHNRGPLQATHLKCNNSRNNKLMHHVHALHGRQW